MTKIRLSMPDEDKDYDLRHLRDGAAQVGSHASPIEARWVVLGRVNSDVTSAEKCALSFSQTFAHVPLVNLRPKLNKHATRKNDHMPQSRGCDHLSR